MQEHKKLITVSVPIFNEAETLDELYKRTTEVMSSLDKYDYEIVFYDDGSTDGTRARVEELCSTDSHIKAVFYSKNFGYSKNIFYCVQQSRGDCTILLHADLQNPPELIPRLIEKWENGAEFVGGIKNKSKENKFLYFMRTMFYFIMNTVFGMKLVPHATEFELFDKSFTDTLKKCRYKNPFLRSIINEYAGKTGYIYYTQDKRNAGKSKFSIGKYYDFAICGIVNMSKKLPRKVIAVGLFFALFSLLEFFIGFVPKAINGAYGDITNALIIRLILFMLSFCTVVGGIMFEYIISLTASADEKPLITEEKRINY